MASLYACENLPYSLLQVLFNNSFSFYSEKHRYYHGTDFSRRDCIQTPIDLQIKKLRFCSWLCKWLQCWAPHPTQLHPTLFMLSLLKRDQISNSTLLVSQLNFPEDNFFFLEEVSLPLTIVMPARPHRGKDMETCRKEELAPLREC